MKAQKVEVTCLNSCVQNTFNLLRASWAEQRSERWRPFKMQPKDVAVTLRRKVTQ